MLAPEIIKKLQDVRPESSKPGWFSGAADILSRRDPTIVRHAWDGKISAIVELSRRVDESVWNPGEVEEASIQKELLDILYTINEGLVLDLGAKILPQLYKISPALQVAAFLYLPNDGIVIAPVLKEMARCVTEATITINKNGFARHREALSAMKHHEKRVLAAARENQTDEMKRLVQQFDQDEDPEKLFCSLLYSNLEPGGAERETPLRDFWNAMFEEHKKDAMKIEAPVLKAEGKDDFLKLVKKLYFQDNGIDALLSKLPDLDKHALYDNLSAFINLFQPVANMRLKVMGALPKGQTDYYSYAGRMISPLVMGIQDLVLSMMDQLGLGEWNEKVNFREDVKTRIVDEILPECIKDFSAEIQKQEEEIERVQAKDSRAMLTSSAEAISAARGYGELPEGESPEELGETPKPEKKSGLVRQ